MDSSSYPLDLLNKSGGVVLVLCLLILLFHSIAHLYIDSSPYLGDRELFPLSLHSQVYVQELFDCHAQTQGTDFFLKALLWAPPGELVISSFLAVNEATRGIRVVVKEAL